MTHSAPTAAQETTGLPRDTCLQCEQSRAQVKAEQTICGIVGGYEYIELEAEWPRHHWRDWADTELAMILPEHRHLYRRATISALQYAPCGHRTRGHNKATATFPEFGITAGHCMDCGHDTTDATAV
jgi:hypothetical protein